MARPLKSTQNFVTTINLFQHHKILFRTGYVGRNLIVYAGRYEVHLKHGTNEIRLWDTDDTNTGEVCKLVKMETIRTMVEMKMIK